MFDSSHIHYHNSHQRSYLAVSKRDRTVALTQVKRKEGATQKAALIDRVREAVDSYESVYIFTYQGLRSTHLQDVRLEWRDSRIFMGKNKVIQIALGTSEADEYQDNLVEVSKVLLV